MKSRHNRKPGRLTISSRATPRVSFFTESEPQRVEAALRALTASSRSSHQQWPDAYLAAFARASGLTLVTFDKALGKLAGKECVLLA